MFEVKNSSSEFKKWATETENLISIEQRVCFMVAYASLERYLYRTALALQIFQGKYSKDARKKLEKSYMESLIGYCSNPKQGGKPKLRSILTKIGLCDKKLAAYRTARNQLVHGADIGDYNVNGESAKLLWEGLRQLSELEFGDNGSHPKAPYQAWQRLPVRRRETANKTA